MSPGKRWYCGMRVFPVCLYSIGMLAAPCSQSCANFEKKYHKNKVKCVPIYQKEKK